MVYIPHHQDAGLVPGMALCLGILNPSTIPRRSLYLGFILIALLGAGLITRYGRRAWNALDRRLAPAILSTERIKDDGTYHKLIFLHHSTGENLIAYGRIRELLTQKGYQFWDHGYNEYGLKRPDGRRTRTQFSIPEITPGASGGGNTDPEGLAVLFAQPVHDPPDNALSRLLQYPVVIFKSCFPNSALKSDNMLERYKSLYLGMRNTMDRHSEHVFVLLTTPPLHAMVTNRAEANRARKLSQWLQSETFTLGHPNLYVFDFYNLLADPATNMLRAEYQLKDSAGDSHPNILANEVIGPQFVDFIDRSVTSFRSRPRLASPSPSGN